MKNKHLAAILIALLPLLGAWSESLRLAGYALPVPKARLSEYGFFTPPLSALLPATGVFAYEVNAPLFSDYAEKARFIYLPAGAQMTYSADAAFGFPEGAVLIKHFYYRNDAAHPEAGRRILETRLLLREAKGWKALTYIWNAEQTDALLEVAGATLPVRWKSADGLSHAIDYYVPNLNQCKGCHSYDGQFVPLGLTVRQLNRKIPYAEMPENQLLQWHIREYLSLPIGFDPELAPRLASLPGLPAPANAPPPTTEAIARAYLDANCGHCHNAHGPASTSGLFLDISETNPQRLGVGKPPVAAGRGSGDRRFSIVPGKPDQSILLFRMESDDPGIRMPELGRQLAHREGIEWIKTWIREMK